LLKKDENRSVQIRNKCSKYLEKCKTKTSLNKEISQLENFLFKVKQVSRGDKAPPIVLRSEEGIQEEQHAIYTNRMLHEDRHYGQTVNYSDSKHKEVKRKSL